MKLRPLLDIVGPPRYNHGAFATRTLGRLVRENCSMAFCQHSGCHFAFCR